MLVLAINSGSSSLKSAVVDPQKGSLEFAAIVENLGTERASLSVSKPENLAPQSAPYADHARAVALVLAELQARPDLWGRIGGVGHRVVHGGEEFTRSVLIDEKVEAAISECAPLAPLHNPANLLGIVAARGVLPNLPHVAVFDTAFHQTMSEAAYRYAVPASWYREHRIRRYGFHGTSHRFVVSRAAELLARPLSQLNCVTAHLGNGCSAAAVAGGRCLDTTMGLTPLEGLVMGTRCGDIDPSVIFQMQKLGNLSPKEIEKALNKESGLLGVSELSHDMRTLQEAQAEHPGARLAIEVFVHRLAKAIGALSTNLERLDAIIFTGGIGEHAPLIRKRTIERLQVLGATIDDSANEASVFRISSKQSAVDVLVVPTNEELMIAIDTLALARAQ